MASSASVPHLAVLFLLLNISSVITSSFTFAFELDTFLRCFHTRTLTSTIVYTRNTTAYNTIFLSTVQNIRFLSHSTTKPLLIITPTNSSHVQAAVSCAKLSGLRIRIRSGGHDYEAMSYVSNDDPFIAVDLINLRSITIDATHNTAWIGVGASLGELYYNIAQKSDTLGFPAGFCPTVGVGGHISGGGIGNMVRKYGTAADNIIDAEIVDANGNMLNRASMGEDLFWAIRGGGGASFGVILSYNIRLVQVPPKVTVFTVGKTALSQGATPLVHKWQSIVDNLDENLYIRIIAQAERDWLVGGNRTVRAQFQSLFLGSRDELLPLMEKSFPELGLQAQDCQEMSWIQSVLYFAGQSNGTAIEVLLSRKPAEFNSSFKGKSDFVREPISERGLEGIWRFLMEGRDEHLVMLMEPLGGRMDEISESAIAFPHRKGNLYIIQYYMSWFERDEVVTQRNLNRMRSLYSYMTPHVSKNPRVAYVNFKDIDLGRTGKVTGASYSKARIWGRKYFKNNFKRLAYVKGRVDPDNFFGNEQSIPPLIQSNGTRC